MRTLPLVLAAVAFAAPALAEPAPADGTLLSQEPCPPNPASHAAYVAMSIEGYEKEVSAAEDLGVRMAPSRALRSRLLGAAEYEARRRYRGFECRRLTYASDGLEVKAFLWQPRPVPGRRRPAVVALRGGNREFGKFGPWTGQGMYALVSAGFVVVGVQYRGADGGEGQDEFGGRDVNDVLAALTLARGLPGVDPERVFLYGESRGGMMVYLALRAGARVRGAVALSALADLSREAERRPGLASRVWAELIPDFEARRDEVLRERSAVNWIDRIETPPLLLLHGTADWRAEVSNSTRIAEKLQAAGRPYALHVLEGDGHLLPLEWRERDRLVLAWLRAHL